MSVFHSITLHCSLVLRMKYSIINCKTQPEYPFICWYYFCFHNFIFNLFFLKSRIYDNENYKMLGFHKIH